MPNTLWCSKNRENEGDGERRGGGGGWVVNFVLGRVKSGWNHPRGTGVRPGTCNATLDGRHPFSATDRSESVVVTDWRNT